MASMRPGKSRVIVTVSEAAGRKETAAGGICGGFAAGFFPQLGKKSQMAESGTKRIGRIIGRKRLGRTSDRMALDIASNFEIGRTLIFPYW